MHRLGSLQGRVHREYKVTQSKSFFIFSREICRLSPFSDLRMSSALDLSSIPLYSPPPSASSPPPPPSSSPSPPFPISPSINAKLSLHTGPAYVIRADALLLPTNESYTERNGVTGDVWRICGKDLEKECAKAEKVSQL